MSSLHLLRFSAFCLELVWIEREKTLKSVCWMTGKWYSQKTKENNQRGEIGTCWRKISPCEVQLSKYERLFFKRYWCTFQSSFNKRFIKWSTILLKILSSLFNKRSIYITILYVFIWSCFVDFNYALFVCLFCGAGYQTHMQGKGSATEWHLQFWSLGFCLVSFLGSGSCYVKHVVLNLSYSPG